MQSVECAVIAAAGLGSRLGHGIPKCMLEMSGSTLLSKLIHSLEPLVQRIHVVMGYREEMIVDLISRKHRNVVLVRNPQYRSTNTAQSMALGAQGCTGKVLFLDGDLIVDPESLRNFVSQAYQHTLLIGVAPTMSENAVYAHTRPGANGHAMLTGFSRTQPSSLEWANVFAGPARILDNEKHYVFNRLEQHIPAPACTLNLREIDTVSDLAEAKRFERSLTNR